MLICGENVNSCSVQRRVQTHVKRFYTFACDAVGLQCWVNFCLLAGTNGLFFSTNCLQIARQGTSANGRVAD